LFLKDDVLVADPGRSRGFEGCGLPHFSIGGPKFVSESVQISGKYFNNQNPQEGKAAAKVYDLLSRKFL
jgi:hypothetical protein